MPGDFSNKNYQDALDKIYKVLSKKNIANGYHIVTPDPSELLKRKEEGYNFIAYGTESSFMKSFLTSNQTLKKKYLLLVVLDLLEATLPNSY